MDVVIETLKELSDNVWEARLEPSEAALFGKPLTESGPITVIQVIGNITPGEHDTTLRFDPRHAHVLNRSQSDRAIVIGNGQRPGHQPSADVSSPDPGPGDQRFLAELADDPDLCGIASRLLAGVRSTSPGSLIHTPARYVESPDNFWAVKPQRRVGSLAITVRGEPDRFVPSSLRIVPDRNGYSRFTINSESQVDEAVAVIRRARRR